MSKHSVYAIHDRDLEASLAKLGILERLRTEGIECEICKTIVTLENLGALRMGGGKIALCCQRLECCQKFQLNKGENHQ